MELTGIQKWHDLDGDNTLALDWDLNEDSHVWEIGGFEGRWAQQIWDKFHCNITIFEPQLWAVERMQKRFEGIEKIEIRPYGLWLENGMKRMSKFETDGCGITEIDTTTMHGIGYFRYVNKEIEEFGKTIDVSLMNIEGAEFSVIPEITDAKLMGRFNIFWCQFHEGRFDEETYFTKKTNI